MTAVMNGLNEGGSTNPSLFLSACLCRLLFWWEGSALQLKQLGLLLVVVVGRPLGNYIQTLIVLALLTAELLYEFLLSPQRFHYVQLMQAAAVCLLVYSTMTVLLYADYDNQASKGGLASVGIIIGVANVLLFAWFVLHIFRAGRKKVDNMVVAGRAWLWCKIQTVICSLSGAHYVHRFGE